MYNNVFDLKPYQKFVIRTDEGKQSCVMFFTQNGGLHCEDCDLEFLSKLICGMAKTFPYETKFTKEEIERANILVQVFGETAKIRKVTETSFVVIGENNSSFISGSYFPSMEVGEVVWLNMISNYKG